MNNDLISREALIDALEAYGTQCFDDSVVADVMEIVAGFPPAEECGVHKFFIASEGGMYCRVRDGKKERYRNVTLVCEKCGITKQIEVDLIGTDSKFLF